ncbi:MAG: DUF6798 domain-containing protein [Anaerolineales bacterium]
MVRYLKAHQENLLLIGLSILFAISYTQYPLFSSNQNTYFLPGFSCAHVGNLEQDWLANTQDATPLFSILVCQTLRWIHGYAIFYFLYGGCLALYFVTFYKIIQTQLNHSSAAQKSVTIALIFLLHSAALRFLIGHLIGQNWIYFFEGGLANQRMLGSVFQPSVFGVFLLVSVYFLLKNRYNLAILSLAIATWFHPTYLLPSAMLLIAYMVMIFDKYKYSISQQTKSVIFQCSNLLLFYLLLISPILIYTLVHFALAPPEISQKAAAILVNYRIPHHADIHTWFNVTSVAQILILTAAIYFARQRPLSLLLMSTSLMGVTLTFIQLISRNNQLALLFPWRISILLMPLSFTILIARSVEKLFSSIETLPIRNPLSQKLKRLLFGLSLGLIVMVTLIGALRQWLDIRRYATAEEIPLYKFVSSHLSPDDLYLVPPKMENFRLASGAASYVDFKSSPYQSEEVLEWYRRLSISNDFFKNPSCKAIKTLQDENISYIVLPTSVHLDCTQLRLIYISPAYSVYQLVKTTD